MKNFNHSKIHVSAKEKWFDKSAWFIKQTLNQKSSILQSSQITQWLLIISHLMNNKCKNREIKKMKFQKQ